MNDMTFFPREGFNEEFQLDEVVNTTTPDHSGFDILLVDSLNLLVKYINRVDRGQNLTAFISKNQDALSHFLYSGRLEYGDSEWRSLVCGVRFFHGNGFVEFMKWTNNCDGIYCSEYLNTGKKLSCYLEIPPC